MSTSRDIERILVIFPGALGDLMCVMPAIGAIAARHRGASIELMARAELARLAVGRTVVTRGHSIDNRMVTALFSDSAEELASAREHFKCFERIYSFFAANHAGYRERLTAATDGVVSFHPFRPSGDGHVAAAYLDSIGEPDAPLDSRVEPTVEDVDRASRAIADAGADASNLIAIFPGSGSSTKNWPVEKFAALARMLAERSSVAIVLGPAESAMMPAFRDASIPVLSNLELGTVAGVARQASAFIGNDSGVSHLAAAVGAPGVVLFGQTDPERWRPLGRVTVIRREPIDSIEPQEIAAEVARISTQFVGDSSNT
ncbi:MAG TPA: glycosyltransferase family 9 protein [Candidatus Acidoferrales bacterium]|nr:glycosyltransferase family 9 protein [Candidatus Acidoferrales bacterium]